MARVVRGAFAAGSLFAAGLILPSAAWASKHVTIDNFQQAECDEYMAKQVKAGAFGRFLHRREVQAVDTSPGSAPKHGQDVIRMNRDNLYSMAVLDLTSNATMTFPDVGGRFLSAQFGSETHDIFPSRYEKGTYILTKDGCGCRPPCMSSLAAEEPSTTCHAFGTRYGFVVIRTLADAANATDIAEAHKAQDAFAISQADAGKWEVPDWDLNDLTAVRNSLLFLASTTVNLGQFGFLTGPDALDHLYGIMSMAAGWAGVRREDQTYIHWLSPANSTDTFTYTVPKVPLEGNGFWSVTVYNKEGFMFANPSNYNSVAQGPGGLNPDGSTTIFFGGCDDPARQRPSAAHCLAIQPGWNIVTRFFRPSRSILDGSWAPPAPVADARRVISV